MLPCRRRITWLAAALAALLAAPACRSPESVGIDPRYLTGIYRLTQVNEKQVPAQVETSWLKGSVVSGGLVCDRAVICTLSFIVDSAGTRQIVRYNGNMYFLSADSVEMANRDWQPMFRGSYYIGIIVFPGVRELRLQLEYTSGYSVGA